MNSLTRADLQAAFPKAGPKVILALESFFRAVDLNTQALGTGTAATSALQDATVLTLSPNDTFNNERIVEAGTGISLPDTGSALIIALAFRLAMTGGHQLTLNLAADTQLALGQSGTVMIEEAAHAELTAYASNAAAITAGLEPGDLYRNGDNVAIVH